MTKLLWNLFFRPEVVGPILWIGILYLMIGGSAFLLGFTIIGGFLLAVMLITGRENSPPDESEPRRPDYRGF